MALYNDMQELIGNTPLVKLNHLDLPEGVNLYAKLELFNPSGSVKDRIGKYMIADAERRGILKIGGTIVEATAGNTGLGIAFAALNKGYKIIFVVPTKFSQEKQTLLRALGAEIINTPREGGMLGAWDKAEERKSAVPFRVQLRSSSSRIRRIRRLTMKRRAEKFMRIWTEISTISSRAQAAAAHIRV